jgi:hypothetical protein
MQWNRCAGLGAALVLAFAAGCLTDVSNLAPYASRIGTTYQLTYAGGYDCELWPPKALGGDYFILPYLKLDGSKKKGVRLKEGTALRIESVRRNDQSDDFVLVTLDDPLKPGHRIRASIQPKYLAGWTGIEEAERAPPPS